MMRGVASKIMADNMRGIQHQMFGHLFPKDEEVFSGYIIVSKTDYGDLVIIKDASNVPSSPWWFGSLMEFTHSFLEEFGERGVIFKVRVQCSVVVEKKKERVIKIERLLHRIVPTGNLV